MITIIDEEPGRFAFGVCKNMTVAVWKTQGTGPAVARLGAVARKVAVECPLGYSAIHVICEGAGLPDGAARTGFEGLMREFSRELACVAVVVGGDGFWASALRAMVTGLWQAVPHKFEMRICGSCEEAANWLCPRHLERTGTHIDVEPLKQALEAAQRRRNDRASQRRS